MLHFAVCGDLLGMGNIDGAGNGVFAGWACFFGCYRGGCSAFAVGVSLGGDAVLPVAGFYFGCRLFGFLVFGCGDLLV
jgi:hypothetical protein